MVWFQCEACGEELKKPKLPNHFRICSAYKLSCIDCGEFFDRQSVQGHTQCITEAEKYGPKGVGKVENGTPGKPNKDKPKPDVDINIGLSDRPPWFCSLCNTQATSKQTLLLHADGKKHRAKVRARVAAQQPKPSEESAPTNKDTTENAPKNDLLDERSNEDKKENDPSKKKRKIDASNGDGSIENGLDNDNVSNTVVEKKLKKEKKAKHEHNEVENGAMKEGSEPKIKWKKLITAALKSTPDGTLKMKKLRKAVMKVLRETGITVDDSELSKSLDDKVNSSSKFKVDGKYVKLAV